MQVNHGDSGGPVYSIKTGAVIGLCDSFDPALVTDTDKNLVTTANGKTLEYNSGLANVVPAKYIVQLLDKNKIRWSAVPRLSIYTILFAAKIRDREDDERASPGAAGKP